MRLQVRDWIATVLVAAIAVPYIGYLVRGEMPFIKDPRGMSATGLVLAAVAFMVLMWGDSLDQLGKTETALAVTSLVLGIAALAFAEAALAEALLAVFMASVAVVWIMKLADHAGLLRRHGPPGVVR